MIILQKPAQETLRVWYLLKVPSPITKSELYPNLFGFWLLIHIINDSEKACGIILSETFVQSLRQRREAWYSTWDSYDTLGRLHLLLVRNVASLIASTRWGPIPSMTYHRPSLYTDFVDIVEHVIFSTLSIVHVYIVLAKWNDWTSATFQPRTTKSPQPLSSGHKSLNCFLLWTAIFACRCIRYYMTIGFILLVVLAFRSTFIELFI